MKVYVLKFREGFNPLPQEAPDGVFCFSSLAAIYTLFTPEQVGCHISTLWNRGVAKGHPYVNKQIFLNRRQLISKQQAK